MANMTFGVNIIPKANANVTLGNSDNPWTITSPALTGTPTAPTASTGTNSTQIATTAFVNNTIDGKADKTDTVLNTTLSRGRRANSTVGIASFAFGDDVTASGDYSHAEGDMAFASGEASHAEGESSLATGNYSHAEGVNNLASGAASHAEGSSTEALGDYSHAEGNNTTASGIDSHAEGYGTIASKHYQHVSGKWNVADTDANGKFAEIVGNGTNNTSRANARALDWDGNEYLQGDLYVNCSSSSANGSKVATENQIPIVIDNLTSTSATDALSANQGKVLNDSINSHFGAKGTTSNPITDLNSLPLNFVGNVVLAASISPSGFLRTHSLMKFGLSAETAYVILAVDRYDFKPYIYEVYSASDVRAWKQISYSDDVFKYADANASIGYGYGTCGTAAATTAKAATLSNYELRTGSIVAIRFTYAVPASATLNVNSKGAKAIRYRNAAIAANIIRAGDTATFVYDGTYYHLISVDPGNMTWGQLCST